MQGRMNERTIFLLVPLFFTLAVSPAIAQVATPIATTFDSGLEGWQQAPGEFGSVVGILTGGNPGGFARFTDAAGNSGGHIIAPSEYLGDWTALEDTASLSWQHMIINPGGGPTISQLVAFISGPGGTARFDSGVLGLVGSWVSASAPIVESSWVIESGTWAAILADVTEVKIRIEIVSNAAAGTEQAGIDNVRLDEGFVPTTTATLTASFDSSLEGWTIGAGELGTVSFAPSGGSPGGYARFVDAVGTSTGHLYAPASWRGNWLGLNGSAELSWQHKIFDLGQIPTINTLTASLSGPGGTAVFDSGELATTSWYGFTAPIVESEWTVIAGTWNDLLSNVTSLSLLIEAVSNGGSGDTDGIDNIVLAPGVDSDFDGLMDSFDNCPAFFNPSQEDADDDGVGDFCDNCKRVANAGQENTGGDPVVGDACALGFLRLSPVAAVDPTFDLLLACGGVAISEINVGLRIPFGADPMTADFGGGCDEPIVSPAPGVPTGGGCVANASLGATIDPSASGAYGPGLSAPFSSESVYAQLRGNGGSNQICDPYSAFVLLGRFTTGPASSFSGATAFIYSGLAANGLELALDTNGQPAVLNGFTSGVGDPDLEIILKPAAGEDEATATRWSLCISEFTDQRMHRISAGLRVPGATTADIRVEGCNTTPDGGGVRACTSSIAATVDLANSFTLGPAASPTAPRVNDTLYVVVEGSAPAPGATTLNPTQFQEWCVATISVDAPPGVAGVPPEFVTDGLETLPFSDMTTDPWQTSSTLLTPLSLDVVSLDNGFNPGDDLDGDGVLDEADNCRFIANVDVVTGALPNNGDVLLVGVNVDNDGDACECGDADGSGGVFAPDLQVIRQHLVGLNPENADAVEAICSVYASGSELGTQCNTKDAVVLERALNLQAPGVLPQCDAAQPD